MADTLIEEHLKILSLHRISETYKEEAECQGSKQFPTKKVKRP